MANAAVLTVCVLFVSALTSGRAIVWWVRGEVPLSFAASSYALSVALVGGLVTAASLA